MNEHTPHIATDPGVTVGEVAIVGAGDIPADAIVAALPRLALAADQLAVWNALVMSEGKVVQAGALQVVYEQVPADVDRSFRQRLVWTDARGEHSALLTLDEFSFRETHGADLNVDSLGQMPAAIAGVLEKSALDLIAERLRQAGLKGRQVEPASAPADEGSIEVKIRIGGLFSDVVGLRLRATPTTLASLADFHSLLALSRSPEIGSRISVPARMEFGSLILPAGDVAGLETGDVLLLNEKPDDAPVTIMAAGRRVGLAGHEGHWLIREIGMADEDPHLGTEEADLAEIGSTDHLPVRVHVELASLDLPVSQLGTWTPGTLVDIGLGPLSNGLPITLRVGGKKLASGNLITIDDRFAVRLSAVGVAGAKS